MLMTDCDSWLAAVQMLLQQFIDFIQARKSVDLEELAAEFGLRVQVGPDPSASSS